MRFLSRPKGCKRQDAVGSAALSTRKDCENLGHLLLLKAFVQNKHRFRQRAAIPALRALRDAHSVIVHSADRQAI
jgi:hypothetical protein